MFNAHEITCERDHDGSIPVKHAGQQIATIYFDTQDPSNTGWAYHMGESSGEVDGEPNELPGILLNTFMGQLDRMGYLNPITGTPEQIRALQLEAANAGDEVMVMFCYFALKGDVAARLRVAKALEAAAAMVEV